MLPTWKRKLAGKIMLGPEINRILLQSKKSWDEVSCLLNGNKKKKK